MSLSTTNFVGKSKMIELYANVVYNDSMEKDFLPQFSSPVEPIVARRMDATVLAFIGDAVQTLAVRGEVAFNVDKKTGALHRMVADCVKATSQSSAVKRILPLLTEDEESVYKRCRNTKKPTFAKNASIEDYNMATGLEGLIGYLYLIGAHDRLNELMKIAYNKDSATE